MLKQRCWLFIPVYLTTTNTATLVIVFRPVTFASRRVVTQTDLFFILESLCVTLLHCHILCEARLTSRYEKIASPLRFATGISTYNDTKKEVIKNG